MLRLITYICLLSFTGFVPAGFLSAQDTLDIQIEDPTAVQPVEYEIMTVTIEGLLQRSEEYLINTSGLTVGRTITIPGDAIPNAIRQLYNTGLYADVAVNHEIVAGGVAIVIIVQGEPTLDSYEIRGVKRSHRNDLRERINLPRGFGVTNATTAQAVNSIKRYYEDEGYWNTTVEVEEELTSDFLNRMRLIFNIDPGEQLKIRRIQFEGNGQFSDRELRRQLDTIKEDKWWRIFKRHVYTEEEYSEAEYNLLLYYRDHGYRDVRIVRDSVYVYDWRGNRNGVSVDITVEEGPQYKVRNVTWEGNAIYTDEQLTTALGFYKGDVFNESQFIETFQIRQDQTDVISMYHNIGYVFSEINPVTEIVAEDSLDIHVEIVENDIATIRDVTFSGNTKTHDDVVRRTLRTLPGQTYSRDAIIRTVRELSSLGYFNPEGIAPDYYPDQSAGVVDVFYELDESQSTDNFEFSGGFGGQDIGVILAARVNFNNFSVRRAFEPGGWQPIPSGDGQRLSLGLQVTGRGYQSYSFSFQEPWLGGKPTSFGVSVSYDILNYGSFRGQSNNDKTELFSSSVSIGRRLNWPDDFFSQQTSFSYQLYNVAGSIGFLGEGKTNILSVTHLIERNSLDNPISPRNGSVLRLSGEVAPPLPGFGQYFKIKTGYQHHNNIIGDLVLSSSVDFGYMGYFLSGTESNFQRFYLGGTAIQQRQSFINDNIDMRGYPGGSTGVISPLDENNNLIGGRVFTKYTMELRYPALSTESVQFIPYLFMDAGNTYFDLNSYDPFNLKRAVGVGARILLPILGLVDLSYGYRMDGTPASARGAGLNSGEWEFLFNMGAPF